MRDKYLGNIVDGDIYEYFDNRICYIDKLHEHVAVVYERERDKQDDWKWSLRSVTWLRENIRTKLEVD